MILRIKEILKEKGKTVVWLASEIDIAQPSMSNIVNGKTNPSLETLEKIASSLEVHISTLFEGIENVESLKCPHCGNSLKIELK